MAPTNICTTSLLKKRIKYSLQSVTPKSPTYYKNTLIGIEKLNSRQLYSLLVYTHPFRPTSQKYFLELFKAGSFDWKQIYLLPRMVTLEDQLFIFQKLTSRLCFFCKLATVISQCSINLTNAI